MHEQIDLSLSNAPTIPLAMIIITLPQLEILLTKVLPQFPKTADQWELPCALIGSEESKVEAIVEQLLLMDVHSTVLTERLGIFFQSDLPTGELLAYLAILKADELSERQKQARNTASWWKLDALPELVHDHISIVAYVITHLRLKLSKTQDALKLLPTTMTLQDMSFLLSTLELMAFNDKNHSTPTWA